MTAIASTVDHIVLASARRVTRRRLLRRAGGLALGATFGTAFMQPGMAQVVAARVACGSVALCRDTRCAASGATTLCHDSLRTRPAGYNRFDCFYSHTGVQCWVERPASCVWTCCDCCVDYNTGSGLCQNCGGLYACICRADSC